VILSTGDGGNERGVVGGVSVKERGVERDNRDEQGG
jgi:hypothetical protein